jgi:hypothetical protein
MTYIINIPTGGPWQGFRKSSGDRSSGHGGAGFGGSVVTAWHPLRVGGRRSGLRDQSDDGWGDGPAGALILRCPGFGWDIAEISSAIAIRLVLFGLMAPVPPR